MVRPKRARPRAVVVLFVLEVFYGILGLISGALLMADPTGALLGLPSSLAERIPFQSFLPVGLFLFVVYGLFSLFLAYGTWTKKELFLGRISKAGGFHWSWMGAVALIVILAVWLAVENAYIGLDYPATYMTILIGLAILACLIVPSTRRYFRSGTA